MRQEKYFTDSEEKVYINLRRRKGHTCEFERVNRDDSDLVISDPKNDKKTVRKQTRQINIRRRTKKIIKKQKDEGIEALFVPLAKAALSVLARGKTVKMAKRNRIIMVKRDVPKRVTPPNGRTFLPRQKRTARANLPANIDLARPCKRRAVPKGKRRRPRAAAAPAAQQQQEMVFSFCKKIAKNKVARNLGKMVLNSYLSQLKSYPEK